MIIVLDKIHSGRGWGLAKRPTAATQEEISVLASNCFSDHRKGVYFLSLKYREHKRNIPVSSFKSLLYVMIEDCELHTHNLSEYFKLLCIF